MGTEIRMGQEWGEGKGTERGMEIRMGVGLEMGLGMETDWDRDRDGKGTETGMKLSPSRTSCSTRERNNHYQLLPFLSQTLPRAMELQPCSPRWVCCHLCSVVPVSREPAQGPAPSHPASPTAAPSSRHIPFVFPFPGDPLIELSRSIAVAAAAVIRPRCGSAGTRLGPRSCVPPAPGSGAAIPNLPEEIRSLDSH